MSRTLIGQVSVRSGILLIIDTGYLNIWSHDRTPVMPEGVLSTAEATARSNTFVDHRLVGNDAVMAGQLLSWSWHPLFLYDQAPERGRAFDVLNDIIVTNGLDVRLERLPNRMPHRRRVDEAIAYGNGAGEVQYHGATAVAVSDVPIGRMLPVWSEATTDEQRRAQVVIDCRDGIVTSSEVVGCVAVDWARMLVGDVDSLGEWQHEEPLDGLADYVFWGKDAERAAIALAAPGLSDGDFGWLNLPVDEAVHNGVAVEDYRDAKHLTFAGDFRPHSHHWEIMKTTRSSPTDSGVIELGGCTVCNFMTQWGDGFFDVYRDVDDSGSLIRIRIEFATAGQLDDSATSPK